MPKNYFESLPTLEYDIDDSGNVKLAIDILTRIRKRSNLVVDGAIFYNYQMQEGDTPEIIADKYYGASTYHWVVMLVNDAYHHVYDFPLSSSNFERYMVDKYGSVERSQGITKIISDSSTYPVANVYSEWYSIVQTSNNNSLVLSGEIPAGNTTTVKLKASSGADPFSTVDVGDEVDLFVPASWYSYSSTNSKKLGYTQKSKILAKSQRSDGGYAISLNMNSNTYPTFSWQKDGYLRVLTGNTSTPVTANGTHVYLDTGVQNDSYATNGYITFTSAAGATDANSIVGNTYAIFDYDPGYKAIILSSTTSTGNVSEPILEGWEYVVTYGGYNLTSGDVILPGDQIALRTGIHHFEMDVYSNDNTLLLENHKITKNEYTNTSIGATTDKRIVTNYDYEVKADNDKRNIILLKKELLFSFVTEFQALASSGVV